MTQNQINYWRYQEEQRHNSEMERLTGRQVQVSQETARLNYESNMASIASANYRAQLSYNLGMTQAEETHRTNVAREQEQQRTNLATETETRRHNEANEINAMNTLTVNTFFNALDELNPGKWLLKKSS